MKKIWIICLLAIEFTSLEAFTINPNDTIFSNKFEKNITSLEYILRNTDNNPYFLDLSNKYCDSILQIDSDNYYANTTLKRNQIIQNTNENNLNYKINFYTYLQNSTSWNGYANSPSEYAYSSSLNQLLQNKYSGINNTEIRHSNIWCLLVAENCTDENAEICCQIIASNSNIKIINPNALYTILNLSDDLIYLTKIPVDTDLDKICSHYNFDKLGIITVKDLNNINNAISVVQSKFQIYSTKDKFQNSNVSSGFSVDKRNLNFYYFIFIISLSIATIPFFLNNYVQLILSSQKWLEKIKFKSDAFLPDLILAIKASILPIIFSFLILNLLKILAPSSDTHYQEFKSLIYTYSLVISITFIPYLINLYTLNKLDVSNFHTINGYRIFSTSTILTTNFYIILYNYIENSYFDFKLLILIYLNAIALGNALGLFTYNLTTFKKDKFQFKVGLLGILFSCLYLVIFNVSLLFKELYAITPFLTSISITAILIFKYFYLKTTQISDNREMNNGIINEKIPFVNSLLCPKTMIFEKIIEEQKSRNLKIFLATGASGIGKTRAILESKILFDQSDWEWYYGDCDEYNNDNTPSFEPFLQAFKSLLLIDEFSDRRERLGENLNNTIEFGSSFLHTDPSKLLYSKERTQVEKMTETCLEILDLLNKKNKKILFILEDLHWVDSETYELLKLFIKIANRNDTARANLNILLSIREDNYNTYRGPNLNQLYEDVHNIESKSNNKINLHPVFTSNSFNIFDFTLSISNKNSPYFFETNTLKQINSIFNQSIRLINLTPKYILQTLEYWLNEGFLYRDLNEIKLKQSISKEDLPSESDVDRYYHQIFSSYDTKWSRVLESAAYIGTKFDAEVLAKVWKYDILEVLDFLEKASHDHIVIDVSNEDNVFEFGEIGKLGSGRRVQQALKSFHKNTGDKDHIKQIILEYNKRLVEIIEDEIIRYKTRNDSEIIYFLKTLYPLIYKEKYYQYFTDALLELFIRNISRRNFEKIETVVSTFKSNKNLKHIFDLINAIIEFKKFDIHPIPILNIHLNNEKHITHDAIYKFLYNIITRHPDQKISLHQSNIENLERTLFEILSPDSAIYIATLISEFKFERGQLNDKLGFIGKMQKELKPNHFGLKLSDLYKLGILYEINEIIPQDKHQLDSRSSELYKEVKSQYDLEPLRVDTLSLKLTILSNIIEDDNRAIEEFKDALENDFLRKDYDYLKVILNFFHTQSANVLFKKSSKKAKDLLNECAELIQRYTDKNAWDKLLFQLNSAWSKYELAVGNLKSALDYCLINEKLLINNNYTTNVYFRNNCIRMAKVYEALGDGHSSIEKRLDSIKALLEEIENNPKSKEYLHKELSIEYNNISNIYRNYLEDYQNALKYAQLSFDLKSPEEGKSYGISLYNIGRANHAISNYDIALSLYSQALQYFDGNMPKDVYQKAILELNIQIALKQMNPNSNNMHLNKAINILEQDEMKVYISKSIQERLIFAKKLVEYSE